MNIAEVIRTIESRLAAVAMPERAEREQRYLKSDLRFMGATVWQIRAAVKELIGSLRDVEHDELLALVDALWSVPVHERRMAAVMVLAQHARRLEIADLSFLERLVRASKTWALVDALAVDVLGVMVGADPVRVSPVMDRWAADPDFWMRRSALLAELRPIRAGATLDRFLARADPLIGETEFFIRKAIGWVLREAGKRRPTEVAAWLAPRTHIASGVTMREAVKYLPPADGARLMTAYRERRPLPRADVASEGNGTVSRARC